MTFESFFHKTPRSERSSSSNDVMVSPKHSKMAFHCEDSRQRRGTNANKQYILTNKIRSYSLIIIKLFSKKEEGKKEVGSISLRDV